MKGHREAEVMKMYRLIENVVNMCPDHFTFLDKIMHSLAGVGMEGGKGLDGCEGNQGWAALSDGWRGHYIIDIRQKHTGRSMIKHIIK